MKSLVFKPIEVEFIASAARLDYRYADGDATVSLVVEVPIDDEDGVPLWHKARFEYQDDARAFYSADDGNGVELDYAPTFQEERFIERTALGRALDAYDKGNLNAYDVSFNQVGDQDENY